MKREELRELHYITPIENVPSILVLGLLSNRRSRQVPHLSTAKQEVQDRRAKVVIPGGRPLHEYVNLYIYGRNATLFRMLRQNPTTPFCVLRVNCDVLDLPNVVIADQNAASDWVAFRPSPDGLSLVDRDLVFSRSWKHPDDLKQEWRHKSAMCAEVLVPDRVAPSFITGAYVPAEAERKILARTAPRLQVIIYRSLFFR